MTPIHKGTSKTSALSKQFKKNIQIKKAQTLLEELEVDKRSINKLMNAKSLPSESQASLQAMQLNYLKRYDTLVLLVKELDEQEQDVLLKQMKLQASFLKKIQVSETPLPEVSVQSDVQEIPVKSEISTEPDEHLHSFEDIQATESPLTISRSDSDNSLQTADISEDSFSLDESREFDSSSELEEESEDFTQNTVYTSKKQARRALLHVYSETMSEDLPLFLARVLPVAYPKQFKLEEGLLQGNGKNKELIEQALGIVDGKIQSNAFKPESFDMLIQKMPTKKRLWHILKSLTPVSDVFTIEQKTDAALDVVDLVRQSKVVKQNKLQTALNVLGYAASYVPVDDHHVLDKTRDLLSGVHEEGDLASWFKRKLNEKKHIMPTRLLEHIQVKWSDVSIPEQWKKQALSIKHWLEHHQEELVKSSDGLLKAIENKGCIIHFAPVGDVMRLGEKNCYVWNKNELSYIDDAGNLESPIPLKDPSRFDDINQRVAQNKMGGVGKYYPGSAIDYLITSNSHHVHKKIFHLRQWLLDFEKDGREELIWDSSREAAEPAHVSALEVKSKILLSIKAYYESEVNMLTCLDELRSILETRLNDTSNHELTTTERAHLQDYVVKIKELISAQSKIRNMFPVPNVSVTYDKAVLLIRKEFESDSFKQYMHALQQVVGFTETLGKIDESHPDFLRVRNIIGTDYALENRSKKSVMAFQHLATQRLALVDGKLAEMDEFFNELSKSSDGQSDSILNLRQGRQSVKRYMKENTSMIESIQAKAMYEQFQAQGNKPIDAARKSMLNVHKPNQKGNTNGYLHALLPVLSKYVFFEDEKKQLGIFAVDKHWRSILDALGQTDSEDKTLVIDAKLFDAKKLDQLMIRYPQEAVTWRILKSLKPIDESFGPMDKVDACIALVRDISERKVIQKDKLAYALNALAYAYKEVSSQPEMSGAKEALETIESIFSQSGKKEYRPLQKWIVHKLNERKEIDIPMVIKPMLESEQSILKEHTHMHDFFNQALKTAKQIKYGFASKKSTLEADLDEPEHLKGPKNQQ